MVTVGALVIIFAFLMRSCTGIGVAVPPSFLELIPRKYPRVLGLLHRIDRGISHLPPFRTIGDHMLLYFVRVEGDVFERVSALSPFFLRIVEIILA
jgi:hypothetical protein